jgi:hypothetical protein
MLKLVMQKHFITIILFLLCLLISRPVEARLTLGVVAGPDKAAGEITSAQANSLAILLAEKLHEDVVVKELADSATLINWLDRFAMLDLALLSTKDVKANPGRFLQVGPFGAQDKFNLVARQGVDGDLPQRIATIVSESDFAPWRTVEAIVTPAQQAAEEIPSPAEPEPVPVDEVTADEVELQHVPPSSPGRRWVPQEERAYRDILPASEPLGKKLVLGLLPDPKNLERSSQQAEQLALYLEQVLPVSIKIREFTDLATFTEWFMRYRMVDLAVLSPAVVKENLGNDYLPIAKFFRTDQSGMESVELVVMRHGQNKEMQAPLQRALLDMMQTAEGLAILAALNISDVLVAEDVSAQPLAVDQEAEPVIAVEQPLPVLAEEPIEASVEELLPPAVEYAEPVEPVAPAEVVVKVLPTFPDVVEPMTVLPDPEMPSVLPELPELATIPIEPIQPELVETVNVPDLMVGQAKPLQLDLPLLPTVAAPITTQPLPEQPAIIVASPTQPEKVVPESVEPLDVEPLDVERQEDNDQQEMLAEVLTLADAAPDHELTEVESVITDGNIEAWTDEEFAAVLGEDLVAAVVAQPDIPRELRPSGVPIVRPGRTARRTTAAEDELLLASIPEPLKNVEPPGLPDLLPEPEPDPGVVYVVPFVAVMVPTEVNARVFDQFVDTLNREGETLGLQFVILKEGLERVSPQWLSARKYVTGEIYAYVEDSGCCSTDLRTKARLTYRRPNQEAPTFGFEYPVKRFFDHDLSSLDVERVKLADDIAVTLSNELLKVLKN